MKILCKIFVVIFLIVVYPVFASASFEGPLQIKNQYPIFLHADQQYLEKAIMGNSMSYSLSHSSTYTVQESGRWLIDLDMEVTEMNFRYKRTIRDLVELDVDIPVLIIGGGFMDGFLDTYHDAFGFPDYGRSDRPKNDMLYEVRRDGVLIVKGESGVRMGDIRFSLKKPLVSSDGLALSIKGDVELPVSNAEKGYSNGSIDAGISILLDKGLSEKIMTYWNFGAVFPGDVKGHETLAIKDFLHGGVAIEAAVKKKLNLLLQVQGHSSIYPETDLLAVDRDMYMISLGGRYDTGKRSFEVSLTEDISTSGAPDFILNFTYKLNI